MIHNFNRDSQSTVKQITFQETRKTKLYAMTCLWFIFNEWCIKKCINKYGRIFRGEFSSGEYSAGEFTTGEFDKGKFSAGEFT